MISEFDNRLVVTELDIRRLVTGYLARRSTLRQFREAVAGLRFDRDRPLTPEALSLLRPIQLWLAELSNRDRTETEFRHMLSPFSGVVYSIESPRRIDANAEVVVTTPQTLVARLS